ncbi:hypothetical protein [Chryseobacterium sp. JK1]|uniref:hypothetical protein n=1 Tax=Chryseobacterium sp. JK1 TaxID=874294 RepID=UPI003D69CE67
MGTLHEVYQLTPKVTRHGAILRVRTDRENLFSEKYSPHQKTYNKGQEIFCNIFVTHTNNGKVRRYALYAAERVIDFKKPGTYLSIQGGTKYGFESDFDEILNEMSFYLEDALFYVTGELRISRYEIKNGTLDFSTTWDFDCWNYNFEEYLLANDLSSPQLIADLYTEETNELFLFHNELIEVGDSSKYYYEAEDYEELLSKISNYKSHIETEKFKKLEDWLKTQINE